MLSSPTLAFGKDKIKKRITKYANFYFTNKTQEQLNRIKFNY